MLGVFWCSIVSKENKHIGCCIVEAIDEKTAFVEARKLVTEDGGEIAIWEMTGIPEVKIEIERWGLGKLFDPKGNSGYSRVGDLSGEAKNKVVDAADIAHVDCIK